MNITIYNTIIHGTLYPHSDQPPADYLEISHLLQEVPAALPEIETRLKQVLGKNSQVNFDADTPVNITQFLSNSNYTQIALDYFPPEIALPLPTPQTQNQRFYYFIITAEAQRIKLRLLQSVEILKDDICAKEEIKDVLRQLARHAKNIQEQTQTNPILACLLTQIVKLYFEITLIFDTLLSETDYISFIDFYFSRLNRQADEGETSAYQTAKHIRQAQQLYNHFDTTTAQKLLPQLYGDLERTPTDNMLIAVICALENAIFMQAENAVMPAFAQIVEANFAKALLNNKKQIFNNRLNAISNAREALTEIDNIAVNLPDLPAIKLNIADLLTSSITRQLYTWLREQNEIYKNHASQIFVPTVQNEGAKNTKPKATKQKITTQEQKSIAQKRFAFLSGYNRKNEKIMSDDDFARLTTYICSLIETGIVPPNIQPISQTGTTSEYLRYTFYLIHKDLYTTRPTRPEWLDLLHAVFTQFQDVEVATTRKKFSTVPPHYEKDVREIEKQKKQ
jgi:hypothetical protein